MSDAVTTPRAFGRSATRVGVIHTVGRAPMPCMVLGLKPKGARLQMISSPAPRFRLMIPETEQEFQCEVLTRTREGVEVVFG